MNKWEYLVVAVAVGTLDQDKLNELGSKRWELALVRTGTETDQLVFKRWRLL